MKRVKLKLSIQEMIELRDLLQLYVQQVNPAIERLRTNGIMGHSAVSNMVTSILCERMALGIGKLLVTSRLYYNITMPPEHAGAAMLAYWTIGYGRVMDVLLEDVMGRIHKQIA